MAGRVPRLRMFAGPNGSGKSTLKAHLRPDLLGLYVNADEVEAARYARCLGLLPEAIAYANRACVFDNSGENVDRTWIAEFTGGVEMELRTVRIPRWFERAVLEEIVF